MKLTLAWTSFILIVIAVLVGISSQGSQQFTISLPNKLRNEETTRAVADFTAGHDWKKELQAAGILLPSALLADLIRQLRQPSKIEQGWLLYQLEYSVRAPLVSNTLRQIRFALQLIETRISLEALVLSYASLGNPTARREAVWAAYGHGFDARLYQFLGKAIPQERDDELASFLVQIRARLATQ